MHDATRRTIDATLILAVWWALWSLCDVYLLAYSPYSEIVVLAFAGACVAGMRVWGRRRYAQRTSAITELNEADAEAPITS